MRLTFIKNNYLLIWNLLYGPSISIKTHAVKQKLWLIYKKEYKAIEQDKDAILKDRKNFIPDDNTLYDLLEDTKVMDHLEKETEKHRMELMKVWDQYKRRINTELQKILRIELPDIQVLVLHPSMDVCLTTKDCFNVGWGKKSDLEDKLFTIVSIIKESLATQISYTEEQDRNIANAILELAVLNECYTRLAKSNYLAGSKDLVKLKKELYPYFLMYLGNNLEDTTPFMMRDNMAFDMEKYTNEVQLRNLNIFEFIDFIVRNQRPILKIKKETVEIL